MSGHFPVRTFCAISKKLTALKTTVSAPSIASRALLERRLSPFKLQAQA
jgi:hypothetical protein